MCNGLASHQGVKTIREGTWKPALSAGESRSTHTQHLNLKQLFSTKQLFICNSVQKVSITQHTHTQQAVGT